MGNTYWSARTNFQMGTISIRNNRQHDLTQGEVQLKCTLSNSITSHNLVPWLLSQEKTFSIIHGSVEFFSAFIICSNL